MKLTLDEIRVVRRMRERGAAVTHLAKDLGVTEGAVRYRLKRLEEGDRLDGRAGQATALDGYEEAVEAIQERLGDRRLRGEGRPCQVRLIYEASGSGSRVCGELPVGGAASASEAWEAAGAGDSAGGDAAGDSGATRLVRGSGFRSGGGYWIWR